MYVLLYVCVSVFTLFAHHSQQKQKKKIQIRVKFCFRSKNIAQNMSTRAHTHTHAYTCLGATMNFLKLCVSHYDLFELFFTYLY